MASAQPTDRVTADFRAFLLSLVRDIEIELAAPARGFDIREQAPGFEQRTLAIHPFMQLPEDPARAYAVAVQLERLEARRALGMTRIATDAHHGACWLVRELSLALEPAAFARAVHGLRQLGREVRKAVATRTAHAGLQCPLKKGTACRPTHPSRATSA
jgi:hypothetical protein